MSAASVFPEPVGDTTRTLASTRIRSIVRIWTSLSRANPKGCSSSADGWYLTRVALDFGKGHGQRARDDKAVPRCSKNA